MSEVQDALTSSTGVAVGRPRTTGEQKRANRGLIVGAALIVGDFLAARLSEQIALVLARIVYAGADPVHRQHLPVELLLLVFLALGLYSRSGQSPYARFRVRGVGILLFMALDCVAVATVSGIGRLVVGAVGKGALLFVLGFYAELVIRHILVKFRLWAAPTVLIGCGEAAQRLYRTLAAQPELGFRPVGFVLTPTDVDVNEAMLPAPVLGGMEDFKQLAENVEVAILTSRDQLATANLIADSVPPANLILLSEAQDIQTLWLRVRALGNAIGIQFERDPYLSQNRALKRAIDLLIAIPAGILALPVIAVLALLIWLVDRGSPFYVQPRVGRWGRPINIPKLRTMYGDASRRLEEYLQRNPQAREEWERFFKLSNDPRILPVIGSFFRRTSLDELPQLWSVIIGDISLVGPRPFPDYHVSSFDAEFQQIRTIVPPGLTGLWQVTARSNGDLEVQQAQDTFYIRNWSIWLDLYILLQTLPAIMSAKGAK